MNDNDSKVVTISSWSLPGDHRLLSDEQFFKSLGVSREIDAEAQDEIRADIVFFMEQMVRVQNMCTVAGSKLTGLTEEQGEKASSAYEWDLSLEETVLELEQLLSGEVSADDEHEAFLCLVLFAHIGQLHELLGLDDK